MTRTRARAGVRTGAGARTRLPSAVLTVRAAAALLAAAGLGHTLWTGIHDPGHALAFGVLITVGELARWGALPGEREPAPLGAAGALAYALLGRSGGESTHHGVLQVVAVLVAAHLVACVPHVARGTGPAPDQVARRVLTVTFAAVCFQPLYNSSRDASWSGEGPYYVLLLLAILVLTALCDAVLAALLLRSRTRHPYPPLLRDELRGLLGIGSAVCATGVVMALGVAVAGLWALPVLCVPLLLTHVSFRRFVAVRTTYRQTIASLARSTEIAGYTPHGHARRVAVLCRAVGRELGLSGNRLTVLEHAALMHDIGQLSLVDPVQDGATATLPAAEQRRIALLGGAVVRQTGVDPEVAVVVERQADPYREQPLSARIVRAVNAYDDLCGESLIGPLGALEQLRLGTAHDFSPEVVESLARVLARGGPAPVLPG
ncbi:MULTISPECIES: HD-GYP domain-containing protein [unclassified Streptomyces]|uniref:HD-GYP domain-containing protein n=1 Tax=unclassified Streptomyces TaxID=2593676 RepID=UPI00224E6B1F|nr:HD domain-containing protein [Streptomyces sp. NBC_01767]MCX4394054.1 metal-dependent phosphohydrolase [Streptomyces sp. NBC_01767]